MEETVAANAPDSASVFDKEISSAVANFDEQLKNRYAPEKYQKLRTIGAFIANGSDREMSCILALIDPEELKVLMEVDPAVYAFVRHKEYTYKAKLLKTLSVSAFGGNVKAAGYLLEQKYREEFGKRGKDDDTFKNKDHLEQAIEFIRESNDENPIVRQNQTLPAAGTPSETQNLAGRGPLG